MTDLIKPPISSLRDWRFWSFMVAQFLGAFNDNALKLVVSMAALSLILDPVRQQSYVAMTSAIAILPFILFSGYAGYFADRYAKSTVLRISKSAEIISMGAVLVIFLTGQSVTHLLIALFLLATHSAFFSPSKYGILPEILSEETLPKANGYLNMLTFVAIIVGSFSGAMLWGTFKETPAIIGMVLTGIAVIGTLLCTFVPRSPHGDARKQFTLHPFREIMRGLHNAAETPILLSCMLGTALFWMFGGLIYLSLILLGKTQLGLSDTASGSLFAVLASGIAVGSVIAGYLIDRIGARHLIVAGAGMLGAACVLTGFAAHDYISTIVLMSVVGLGGGLFVVPLVTLLQQHAPDAVRGQVLATGGFFDMVGVLLASGIFWLMGAQWGLTPAMQICAVGIIALVGLALAYGHLRPHVTLDRHTTLGQAWIHTAKRALFVARMADTRGMKLNGLRMLVGARLLARWLAPRVGATPNIALLLPASVPGALANLALAMLGKTSVNLNFSLGAAAIEASVRQAEITHIVTARKVVEKLGMAADARMIFIEDSSASITMLRRGVTIFQAIFLSSHWLCRAWLRGVQQPDATATILFSSGSTSAPKAVMLSHAAILSNTIGIDRVLSSVEAGMPYRMAGVLPFFHAFGLTGCLWLPVLTARYVCYHANPLEAKSVTRMIAQSHAHLLIATPTFARHYTAVAKQGALDSLRIVMLGGEKLTAMLEAELSAKLPHANVLQGYGATELGPVVAFNAPDVVGSEFTILRQRAGSVGKPILGVNIRVVDRTTQRALPAGEEGMILVQSPSVMQGYYHDAKRTGEVLQDGWYNTGDIGHVDADGFVFLTGRAVRFSKIGGEMVPHEKLEEAIAAHLGAKAEVVVVARDDASKGEALYALIASTATREDLEQQIAALPQQLKQAGVPNLWIPARDHVCIVDAIPHLPSGKYDLRACRELAQSHKREG